MLQKKLFHRGEITNDFLKTMLFIIVLFIIKTTSGQNYTINTTYGGTLDWQAVTTSISDVYLNRSGFPHSDGYDGAFNISVSGTNITYSSSFHFSYTYGAVIQQVVITNTGGSASNYTINSSGNLGSDGSSIFHYSATSGYCYTISSDNSGATTNGSDPVISMLYGVANAGGTVSMNFNNNVDAISYTLSSVNISAGATHRYLFIGGVGDIDDTDYNRPDMAYQAVQNLLNVANWPADFTNYLTDAQKKEVVNWSAPNPEIVTANPVAVTQGASSQLYAQGITGTAYWYSGTFDNGTLVGTGNPITITPSSTTTYYVKHNINGFYSVNGSAYTLNIYERPGVPTNVTASPDHINVGETSQLNATSSGNTINWYTVPTGGTSIGSSSSGANFGVTPGTTTTYYAESQARLTALGSVMHQLHNNYTSVTNEIPGMYSFYVDNENSCRDYHSINNYNHIVDGGSDMYDHGNYLSTNYSTDFNYSDHKITNGVFGTNGKYFTQYLPGLFILAADMDNVSSFSIRGDFGSDGSGSYSYETISLTINGQAYSCYLNRVYSAGDPSINQMIIIPQNGSAVFSPFTNTASGTQTLSGIQSSTRLYYLLYAGTGGGNIGTADATDIATAFLNQIHGATVGLPSSTRSSVTVTIDLLSWTGAVNSDWNTSGNWNGNAVPTSSQDALIPNTINDPIIANGSSADCYNLTINSGATLTIESGGSLITAGTISNSGTVNIEHSMSQGVWHFVSSPVANATAEVFMGDYLQYYDETLAVNNYISITDEESPLEVMKGYGWRKYNTKTNSDFTFSGTPNNGSLSIATTQQHEYGWNLVGNPYPSSLDWNILDGTYGTIYRWTGTQYSSYNDGASTNEGTQYVAPMQGFFISTSGAGSFAVNNSHRTHSGATGYVKEGLQNFAKIKAVSGQGYDEWFLQFGEEYTQEFDRLHDGWKMNSGIPENPEIYSKITEGNLSIDRRPECQTIALGFNLGVNSQAQLALTESDGMADATIEDTKLNLFHNLSNGVYSFDWNTTDSEERFILHLKATGTADLEAQAAQVYAANQRVYVRLSELNSYSEMAIYDLSGRLVLSKPLAKSNLQSFELDESFGAYLVQLKGNAGTESFKIVL